MEKNITEKQRQFIVGLEKLTRETGITVCIASYDGDIGLRDAVITSDESGYSYEYDYLEWVDPLDKHKRILSEEYFNDNKQSIVK